GAVPVPLLIQPAGREIPADQIRRPPPALALPGRRLAPALGTRDQAMLAHDRCDGVLPHPPPRIAQIVGDPRRTELAVVRSEQLPDRDRQLLAPGSPRRRVTVAPLVEPGLGHAQRPAGRGMRNPVLDPLGCDEPRHGYRLIASSTQRAALRLSTSHRIRSSAFSFRSRRSSSRSLSLNAPSPCRRRSCAHQLPSVPSLTPSSRATWAIGLPVSRTSRPD